MQIFQEETLVRQLISNICNPFVERLAYVEKELEKIQLFIHQHSRRIDILADQSDQQCFDIKLSNDAIEHLKKNAQDDYTKVFEIQSNFNLDLNKIRLEQGTIKLEQQNQKKEITILGEGQQSLTERVEIYNNYLSQKLYQQELAISNFDTSNSKVSSKQTEINVKNQEEISTLQINTQNLLQKIQSNEQEITKIQCSKQWMQDMIVDLRQKSQYFLTIDQTDLLQQTHLKIVPPILSENLQIKNQVDKEQIQDIIDEKIKDLSKNIDIQIQQSKEQNKIQIEELKMLFSNLKQDFSRKHQLMNSNLKDTNEKLLNAVTSSIKEYKMALNQIVKEIDEQNQVQFQKISQEIQTIQTQITGLDLRMAETHLKVVHIEEKQKEIQIHQTSFQYLNNQNDIITYLPQKPDYFQNDNFQVTNTSGTSKIIKTDQSLQVQQNEKLNIIKQDQIQLFESDQMNVLMQNQNQQEIIQSPKTKVYNDIIKLKSDFFNEQQYNQNQMNKLLRQNTVTDQILQDINKQLKQFNQYFCVIFSLILHNELIGTDFQVKINGNGFKFEFLPFQQDERTIMSYQNNKIAKVDLITKTINVNHSIIKKQRQNTFDFQQEKKRFNTETTRELKTTYNNKKNRFQEDRQVTQTERLNLSLDITAYQQLPQQKVKKVLVKYKRLLD
ncbi:unnamed protein product [Paramecium sonneborni]|uniref:Uncharacterized protein n=1 Tax=Paramecium sonneborni TaxID=65129 RepID=A0A8S1KNV8_9CILI|nr:unnamed protein product [Paramecium sonneborni]